jgi:peptidoglycan/xylan/chitin deacetylase (PgdA/CDA1 family)
VKTYAAKTASDNTPTRNPIGSKAPPSLGKKNLAAFPTSHALLQPKLKIGQPNDKYEREAEQMADRVMEMPEPKQSLAGGDSSKENRVQRQSRDTECPGKEEKAPVQSKPPGNQITPLVQRQAEPEEEEEEEAVQARQTSNHTPHLSPGVQNRIQSIKGGGQPLPNTARNYFEPRFGHDFSQVRVHTDSQAAETARSIYSKAFTTGKDVVFAAGQYSPGTPKGNRLLAHELTHVVQQGGRERSVQRDPDFDLLDTTITREHADELGARGEIYENIEFLQGELEKKTKGDANYSVLETNLKTLMESAQLKTLPVKKTKKVCLTFDDGPQNGTEEALDVLKAKSAPATFFLTGRNMKANGPRQRALVERMLTEGHQIGNHTYTHDPTTGKQYRRKYGDLSNADKEKKFRENYELNRQHFDTLLKGSKTPFPGFSLARLPGQGRFISYKGKKVYVEATEKMGMKHVGWQFEFAPNKTFRHLKVSDWKGVTGVSAEVNRYPKASEIILFHDRHWAGSQKSKLDATLTELHKNGCVFGRLNKDGKCS